MLSLTTLLPMLAVSLGHVAADPEYERARQMMNLHARKEDLSFCFGINSICAVANDLHSDCSDANDGDSLTPWYECLCGNGYVASNEACYWCQQTYHLENIIYAGEFFTSECSSAGVTVAPIPSSVLALESSYNSTYTGIISGADAGNTGSPIVSASVTDDGSATTSTGGKGSASKTPRPSPSRTTSDSNTWFGGETSVVTLSGGGGGDGQVTTDSPDGNPTSSPSSSLRSGGDSPGSAQHLNIGAAVAFSAAAFGLGVSVLYLM